MPFKDEVFCGSGEVDGNEVKESPIHCGSSVAPLLCSHPFSIHKDHWIKQRGAGEVVAMRAAVMGR